MENLIKAPDSDVYICDACARIVFSLINDGINRKKSGKMRKALAKSIVGTRTVKKGPAATPAEILREIDRFVIGQERAKKTLAVAVYNHGKRLRDKSGLIKKSNILLIGPTGCGKTLFAKTLATLLDVPFAMADATGMTEAGYVGDDVEICLRRLLDAAGGDVELAQKGVVFIDEIDKIACKDSGARDVGGGGVQAALLKLIEGCVADVPINGSRRSRTADYAAIDTTDILFICGGAFDGLTNKRCKEKRNIGFNAGGLQEPSAKNSVSVEEIVKYGLMPELASRLPIVCTLDSLTEKDFVRILTEPEDAVTKEYELLLKKDGVNLAFEPEALSEIARMAAERNTGARGLRSILEDVMLDIMYELPNHKDISECVVTGDSIKTRQPTLIKKSTENSGMDGRMRQCNNGRNRSDKKILRKGD